MKNGISAVRRAACSVALFTASFCALSQTSNQNAGARLPDVIVSASRFAESSNALPYGVSVITAEQIESSGASSVSEVIMKVLGVPGRLDLSGANNYSLDLRGFGETSDSNQVVIVDGHRLNEQDTSKTALGSIPIDQVQRIEILRGSAAVLYGEGATAGVILVTTKLSRGVERPNSALVSATFGSFGTREGRASATLSEGGFSLDIASRNRESDGHRDNFASSNTGLGVTAQWANDWLRVGVKNSRSAIHSGLPGGISQEEFDTNPKLTRTPRNYADINSDTTAVFSEAFAGDWQFGMDLTKRKKQIDSNYISPTSSSRYTYETDASSVNSRARYEFKGPSYQNAITLGLDHEEWGRVDSGDADLSRAHSNSDGLYVNNDIDLLNIGTRLSVGLRSQNISRTRDDGASGVSDNPSAWSLGFTQALIQTMQVFGRTGNSFRMANADEFNFITPGKLLKTQTSKDLEFGARFRSELTRAELRWYHSALTNEIVYDQNAAGPYSVYGSDGANVNLDPTKHTGLELETYHQWSDQLGLRLNVATKQAQFVSGPYANKTIALVPSNTLALGAEIKPAAGHRLNVGITWMSNQYVDFKNTCTVPANSTLDARYVYSTKSAELGLGVSNLGDSKYFSQGYGCDSDSGAVKSIYPEPGRAFSATAKLKF